MPRLSEICADLATRFRFDEKTVTGYARALREDGLLTSGARGVNAPEATALDAARLIIPMMVRSKIVSAVHDVRLLGAFPPHKGEKVSDAFAPQSFEDAISGMIEFFGRFPAHGPISDSSYRNQGAEIRIVRDQGYGKIYLASTDNPGKRLRPSREAEVLFFHPEISEQLAAMQFDRRLLETTWRFASGFHEEPHLDTRDLIGIGQVVAGHQRPGWQVI